MCHCTKFDRAATAPGFVVVAARLSLVVWGAYYSRPALEAIVTGVDAATRGLRLWLSTATAPPFKTMASKLPHERLNRAPIFDYLICKVLFKPIHSTTVLVPTGTSHPLPVPSGTGSLSEGCRRRVGCVPLHRVSSSRNWAESYRGCGSIVFGGVGSLLLAACARGNCYRRWCGNQRLTPLAINCHGSAVQNNGFDVAS